MESCPAELIAYVLEYIPLVDLGKTARSLGLVSKYYRRVAKPFEFRALVIIGDEQLKATLGRIETEQAERGEEAMIDTRHLFIREMEPDLDLSTGYISRDGYSMDLEELATWRENVDKYKVYANEFRTNTATLIQKVHTTLVTLSIIQRLHKFYSDLEGPYIISGLSFPRLENLVLEHRGALSEFDFVHPTAPLLRSIHLSVFRIHNLLCIFNPGVIPGPGDRTLLLHPLLANMHSHYGALTHLVLSGGGIYLVDDLLAALCGSVNGVWEFKSTLSENHKLPGRLVHAVLKPRYQHDREAVLHLCNGARALCINGLEVQAPHFVPWEIRVRECNNENLEEFERLARERW